MNSSTDPEDTKKEEEKNTRENDRANAAKTRREKEEQEKRTEEKNRIAIAEYNRYMAEQVQKGELRIIERYQFAVYNEEQIQWDEKGKIKSAVDRSGNVKADALEDVDIRGIPQSNKSDDSSAVISLHSGLDRKPIEKNVYYIKEDPNIKIDWDGKGGKAIDIKRPFDRKKYLDHLYHMHKVNGDLIVKSVWPDPKAVTEKAMKEVLKAAKKHGIQIEWDDNANQFLKNPTRYKMNYKTGDYDENPPPLTREQLLERQQKFAALVNETEREKDKRVAQMQPFLDPVTADGYVKHTKNDLKAIPAKSDDDRKKELEDLKNNLDKKVEKDDKKEDKLDDKQDEHEEYNETLEKCEKTLDDVEARLEKIESIEKRLKEEDKFYEEKIKGLPKDDDADQAEKIGVLDKLVPDHLVEEHKKDREELIKNLKNEKEDLKNRRQIIGNKVNEITGKINNKSLALQTPEEKEVNKRAQAVQKGIQDLEKKSQNMDKEPPKPDSQKAALKEKIVAEKEKIAEKEKSAGAPPVKKHT